MKQNAVFALICYFLIIGSPGAFIKYDCTRGVPYPKKFIDGKEYFDKQSIVNAFQQPTMYLSTV